MAVDMEAIVTSEIAQGTTVMWIELEAVPAVVLLSM